MSNIFKELYNVVLIGYWTYYWQIRGGYVGGYLESNYMDLKDFLEQQID